MRWAADPRRTTDSPQRPDDSEPALHVEGRRRWGDPPITARRCSPIRADSYLLDISRYAEHVFISRDGDRAFSPSVAAGCGPVLGPPPRGTPPTPRSLGRGRQLIRRQGHRPAVPLDQRDQGRPLDDRRDDQPGAALRVRASHRRHAPQGSRSEMAVSTGSKRPAWRRGMSSAGRLLLCGVSRSTPAGGRTPARPGGVEGDPAAGDNANRDRCQSPDRWRCRGEGWPVRSPADNR